MKCWQGPLNWNWNDSPWWHHPHSPLKKKSGKGGGGGGWTDSFTCETDDNFGVWCQRWSCVSSLSISSNCECTVYRVISAWTVHAQLSYGDKHVCVDTECPLLCISAVNALSSLNTCTHLATVRYGAVWSRNAARTSAWHCCVLLPHRSAVVRYKCWSIFTKFRVI
jgi:hypothetical protein